MSKKQSGADYTARLSCDYDTAKVEVDPRLKSAKKDGIVLISSMILLALLAWIPAYTLSPSDISEMTWLLGLPRWFAVSALICFAYVVFGIVWAIKTKKFSLEARADDREVDF